MLGLVVIPFDVPAGFLPTAGGRPEIVGVVLLGRRSFAAGFALHMILAGSFLAPAPIT